MVRYHDCEWGVPVWDDKELFEHLMLDGFQAGLSWSTILNKRENFRRAFAGFDPDRVARFNRRSVERLLNDAGIVRNRQKIEATIGNAKAFLRIRDTEGSFADLLWGFVEGETRHNRWKTLKQLPAHTAESDAMSAALKARGFAFVGSTICYAFMQAVGMVNDHIVSCFRYTELGGPA
jgi:DNA-3-methyladenine glycosylase I